MKKKKILNTRLTVGQYKEYIDNIISLAEEKKPSYVCVTNVHMLIEGFLDKSFQSVVNHATMATPDGMPLARLIRAIYHIPQDRVAGMDLMPSLLKEAEAKSLSVYFYGSTEEMLQAIVAKANKDHPNLKIAGHHSPPFRNLTQDEKDDIVTMINDANPQLLLVALGCPKQEKWMAEHKNKIYSCMVGVGGAFPVYAGLQKRAPLWMQKMSLEWFYRFIQEPGRLWKRYLVTNSLFSLLLMKFSVDQFFKRVFSLKRRPV